MPVLKYDPGATGLRARLAGHVRAYFNAILTAFRLELRDDRDTAIQHLEGRLSDNAAALDALGARLERTIAFQHYDLASGIAEAIASASAGMRLDVAERAAGLEHRLTALAHSTEARFADVSERMAAMEGRNHAALDRVRTQIESALTFGVHDLTAAAAAGALAVREDLAKRAAALEQFSLQLQSDLRHDLGVRAQALHLALGQIDQGQRDALAKARSQIEAALAFELHDLGQALAARLTAEALATRSELSNRTTALQQLSLQIQSDLRNDLAGRAETLLRTLAQIDSGQRDALAKAQSVIEAALSVQLNDLAQTLAAHTVGEAAAVRETLSNRTAALEGLSHRLQSELRDDIRGRTEGIHQALTAIDSGQSDALANARALIEAALSHHVQELAQTLAAQTAAGASSVGQELAGRSAALEDLSHRLQSELRDDIRGRTEGIHQALTAIDSGQSDALANARALIEAALSHHVQELAQTLAAQTAAEASSVREELAGRSAAQESLSHRLQAELRDDIQERVEALRQVFGEIDGGYRDALDRATSGLADQLSSQHSEVDAFVDDLRGRLAALASQAMDERRALAETALRALEEQFNATNTNLTNRIVGEQKDLLGQLAARIDGSRSALAAAIEQNAAIGQRLGAGIEGQSAALSALAGESAARQTALDQTVGREFEVIKERLSHAIEHLGAEAQRAAQMDEQLKADAVSGRTAAQEEHQRVLGSVGELKAVLFERLGDTLEKLGDFQTALDRTVGQEFSIAKDQLSQAIDLARASGADASRLEKHLSSLLAATGADLQAGHKGLEDTMRSLESALAGISSKVDQVNSSPVLIPDNVEAIVRTAAASALADTLDTTLSTHVRSLEATVSSYIGNIGSNSTPVLETKLFEINNSILSGQFRMDEVKLNQDSNSVFVNNEIQKRLNTLENQTIPQVMSNFKAALFGDISNEIERNVLSIRGEANNGKLTEELATLIRSELLMHLDNRLFELNNSILDSHFKMDQIKLNDDNNKIFINNEIQGRINILENVTLPQTLEGVRLAVSSDIADGLNRSILAIQDALNRGGSAEELATMIRSEISARLENRLYEIAQSGAEARLLLEKISFETTNLITDAKSATMTRMNTWDNERFPALRDELQKIQVNQLIASAPAIPGPFEPRASEQYAPAPSVAFQVYLDRAKADFPKVYGAWRERLDTMETAFKATKHGNAANAADPYSRAFRSFLINHAQGRILDVGCGPFGRPYYLDFYPAELVSAVEPLPMMAPADFELVRGISEYLPWPDHSFSTVVSGTSLDHCLSLDKSLAEMKRVLSPDGRVLLWIGSNPGSVRYEPDRPDYQPADEFHLFHFDRMWFEPVLERTFVIEEAIDFPKDGYSHVFYSLKVKPAAKRPRPRAALPKAEGRAPANSTNSDDRRRKR